MSGAKPYLDPPQEAAEWLDAARAHQLLIQRCGACGRVQHYPRTMCTACGTPRPAWMEASGRGTVHTFTVVHRNRVPGWSDETPYVVAMIDLEEGARIMSNIVGCDPADVRIGMPVLVRFVDDGTHVLPKFHPA